MIQTATILVCLLALAIAVPALCLMLQICAALFYRETLHVGTEFPRIAVVVPAHNEAALIHRTIHSILAQLPAGARLLVVADNCTDNTADVALAAGAEVSVRQD